MNWVKRLVNWLVWGDEFKSPEEIPQGIDNSMRTGAELLFFASLILGHLFGALLLIRQFFPDSNFAIPVGLLQIYITIAGAFATVNQIDLWFTSKKRFRKGERIFIFWPVVIAISALAHFFSKGMYPFAAAELKEIAIWISGLYVASKASSGIRKKTLDRAQNIS
ncbi:MAG TPA: hypothetical protein VJB70_05160 [Candidatus Paceibacterota bacterium]